MTLRFANFSLPSWGWALPLSLLLALTPVRADNNPPNITPGEVALLPEYCKDTQSFGYGDASFNTSPRAAYWVGLMGKTFWALHHQCWAMIREHRSRAAGLPRQERDGYLRGAIGDYMYVIEHSTPGFVLLPEIYTQMAEDHVLLGNIAAAYDAFTAARRSKADYWPPYVGWARVLLKSGKRQEALAHVEQVLKLVPDDAELKRQYNLLRNGAGSAPRAAEKNGPRRVMSEAPAPRGAGASRPAAMAVSTAGSKAIAASAATR
jgi:tetratricopeptide (TPR) repeat protein